MKLVILLLTLLSFNLSAAELEVDLLCQQDDGDQWYEVGVSLSDGPQVPRVVIIEHIDDTSSVIFDNPVRFVVSGGKNVFENKALRLSVANPNAANPTATLVLLRSGAPSIFRSQLICYKGETLEF